MKIFFVVKCIRYKITPKRSLLYARKIFDLYEKQDKGIFNDSACTYDGKY